MTPRERLIAASRGGDVDRKPRVTWFGGEASADAKIVAGMAESARRGIDGLLLADVANPFGLALRKGIDLNKALKDDPSVGGDMLNGLVGEVRQTIAVSLASGADGIFYRLHGACPRHCSPMQYGGHYLELDRELLDGASQATLNILFVAGGDELYVDFVSDLPAHVFAWDSELSKIPAVRVRAARAGALASADPNSDVALAIGRQDYLDELERPEIG